MTSPVDRITAVLVDEGLLSVAHARKLAQRVAAELQLTEETFYSRSPDVQPRRRWVSAWSTVEGNP